MKLHHKLLIGLLPVALVSSILVGVGSFSLIRSAVEQRYVDRLRAESALLATWLASTEESGNDLRDPAYRQHLQATATLWSQLLEVRVTLIDSSGQVIGDSELSPVEVQRLDSHSNRPEVILAGEQEVGKSLRQSATTGESFYYLARRVRPSAVVSVVRLALPEAQVRQTQGSFLWSAIALSLLSLLVIAGLSYVGALLLIRPIGPIADAAESVAEGDFDRFVPSGKTQELDRLSTSISNMRDSLVSKIGQLETRQALFDSVVSGMRGGVMVVDDKGVVRLANGAAQSILRVDSEPAGETLSRIARRPELAELVSITLADGLERGERIRSPGNDERYFDVHVSPLVPSSDAEPPGVLVLLYDITRIEALEALRKKFVADLSHELRTPLTSIQAAAETLLDGGRDDEAVRERFLTTITRHAERMTELLSDLTDLSRIETGAISLDRKPLDVVPIIRDVIAQLEPKFAKRQLEVSVDLDGPVVLSVDRLRFEQILVNLLDNAMKFNRVGGWVRVTGTDKTLRIADSGPGIPEEDRTRIFHRFFRLDSARSRKPGGTGLGLAIVKHLMTLHGGSVSVESETGEGSVFVLDFS